MFSLINELNETSDNDAYIDEVADHAKVIAKAVKDVLTDYIDDGTEFELEDVINSALDAEKVPSSMQEDVKQSVKKILAKYSI